MSETDLRAKLRSMIFQKQFSRLPDEIKTVQVEKARTIVEEQMVKMKEGLRKSQEQQPQQQQQ